MTEGSEVLDAYRRRADEYTGLLGTIDATRPEDRELVSRWAAGVGGPILDVGCGPGHWTDFLTARGRDVQGIDPVPRFIELARRAFPASRYRVGGIHRLDVPDGSLGGVLAWYSLIHLEPDQLPEALTALHRALQPGGSLLVGFFTGENLTAFPHVVVRAYAWPVTALVRHLAGAGFRVEETHHRVENSGRRHGALVATKPAGR